MNDIIEEEKPHSRKELNYKRFLDDPLGKKVKEEQER